MARLVFVTSLRFSGSTIVGRILPLAKELSRHHEVHLIVMQGPTPTVREVRIHTVGQEPFTRTPHGKIRLRGLSLIWCMAKNAWLVARQIRHIKADTMIMVKPLPQNVLAIFLVQFFAKKPVILDCDDFELTANQTTSLLQRASIHLSQHLAAKLSQAVIVATPFLQDIWQQLTHHQKKVVLIPTGVSMNVQVKKGEAQLAYIGSVSIASGHRVDMVPDILQNVRQQIPTLPLLIIGDGDDLEKIKREFAQRNIGNISYLGRFEAEKISQYLTDQTIIIDPVDASITNRAKSSYRANLAAALQIPLVTSNIGIRSRIVPAGLHEKFFAIPGDAASYAEKISSLAKQPLSSEEKTLLHDASREYTWNVLSQQYAATLEASI